MFVTTAGRTTDEMINTAKKVAMDLQCVYIPRRKRSIFSIQQTFQEDCMVVGKTRLELYPLGEKEPFFFHPNSASFRIKRLMNGDQDPFLIATKLHKGMTFLDCTLGLGSDSIVASFAVGEMGKVIGIEGNPFVSYIVRDGLQKWQSEGIEMNRAMRSIEVVSGRFEEYLKNLPTNSVDVVYFDPMFDNNIPDSDGIRTLTTIAIYDDLTANMMLEAKRVARNRIVLKDHFRSKRFSQFGFQVNIRKNAKFHFGVLNVES